MMSSQPSRIFIKTLLILFGLAEILLLQGCLHDEDDAPPAPTYSIGGTVSGLSGNLVLQNQGASDITITTDGNFSFGSGFGDGAAYSVTVKTNPAGQACKVSNGSGSVSGASVSNISVSCVSDQDASGIFTGTAELNTEPKAMPTDIKGMIYNNRFYVFSTSQHVLYDGTITKTSGNDISGTVDVYVDGTLQDDDASFTGFVTNEDKITFTLNGTEKGNGTVELSYNSIYKTPASHARIEAAYSNRWKGQAKTVIADTMAFRFEELTNTVIGWIGPSLSLICYIDPNLAYADSYKLAPTNIYQFIDFVLSDGASCPMKTAGFNGYGTVVDNGGTANELWFVLVNGNNSLFGVLHRL